MLWIALAFPHLPLEACCRTDDDTGPRAIVRQHRVTHLDDAALAAGVRPGQKRAEALAICPPLRVIERDATRERGALDAAALALMRYTPAVARIENPIEHERGANAGLLLEVQGSLRLFGGFTALVHAIRFTLAELGLNADVAAFPTATGAWLLAQAPAAAGAQKGGTNPDAGPIGPAASGVDSLDALDVLPVHVLDAAQPHLDTLAGIGVATLRELRLLPRAGVARRFGQAILDELDRACGAAPDPRPWLQAPAEFHAGLELFARVEHAEALLFAARRLLVQLVGWLDTRHAAIRAFTLEFEHEFHKSADRQRSELTVTLAEASRDPDHLALLLRERLARTALTAPVLEIALHATCIEALPAPNTELFPTAANEAESLTRLVERLSARLGADAIERIELVEDHRPEAAQRMVAYARAKPGAAHMRNTGRKAHEIGASGAADAGAHQGTIPPRPAWLLREPVRLPVRNHRPLHRGPLTLVAGPERIEAGWWNGTACRDYFIAENDDTELLWIYRERLTGGDEHWYLQGKFA